MKHLLHIAALLSIGTLLLLVSCKKPTTTFELTFHELQFDEDLACVSMLNDSICFVGSETGTIYLLKDGKVIKRINSNEARIYNVMQCGGDTLMVGIRNSGVRLIRMPKDSVSDFEYLQPYIFFVKNKDTRYSPYSFAVCRDTVYAATSNGLYWFLCNGDSLNKERYDLNYISYGNLEEGYPFVFYSPVAIKNSETLWFATDSSLVKYTNGTLDGKNLKGEKILKLEHDNDTLYALGKDRVYVYSVSADSLISKHELKGFSALSMIKAKDKFYFVNETSLYVAHSLDDLAYEDKIVKIDLPHRVPSDTRNVMVYDEKADMIRIVTDRALLSFPAFNALGESANSITHTFRDNTEGTSYFLTSRNEVYKLKANDSIAEKIMVLPKEDKVSQICAGDGTIYYITSTTNLLKSVKDNFLYRYIRNPKECHRFEKTSTAMAYASGKLFVAVRDAICEIDVSLGETKYRHLPIRNDVDVKPYVTNIVVNSAGVWLATLNDGLWHIVDNGVFEITGTRDIHFQEDLAILNNDDAMLLNNHNLYKVKFLSNNKCEKIDSVKLNGYKRIFMPGNSFDRVIVVSKRDARLITVKDTAGIVRMIFGEKLLQNQNLRPAGCMKSTGNVLVAADGGVIRLDDKSVSEKVCQSFVRFHIVDYDFGRIVTISFSILFFVFLFMLAVLHLHHKNQQKKREKEIVDLQQENENKQQKIENLGSQMSNLQTDYEKIKKEYDFTKEELDIKQEELSCKQEEIANLERDLKAKQIEYEQTQKDKDAYGVRLDRLKKDSVRQQQEKDEQIKKLQKESAWTQQEKNKQIKKLQEESFILQQEKDEQIKKLQKESAWTQQEKNKQIKKLQEERFRLQQEKNKQIKKLQEESFILQQEKDKQIKKLQEESFILQQEKDEQIKKLQKDYDIKEETIAKFGEDVKKLQQKLDNSEKERATLLKIIKDVEDEQKEKKDKLKNNLKNKLDELKSFAKIINYNLDITELNTELKVVTDDNTFNKFEIVDNFNNKIREKNEEIKTKIKIKLWNQCNKLASDSKHKLSIEKLEKKLLLGKEIKEQIEILKKIEKTVEEIEPFVLLYVKMEKYWQTEVDITQGAIPKPIIDLHEVSASLNTVVEQSLKNNELESLHEIFNNKVMEYNTDDGYDKLNALIRSWSEYCDKCNDIDDGNIVKNIKQYFLKLEKEVNNINDTNGILCLIDKIIEASLQLLLANILYNIKEEIEKFHNDANGYKVQKDKKNRYPSYNKEDNKKNINNEIKKFNVFGLPDKVKKNKMANHYPNMYPLLLTNIIDPHGDPYCRLEINECLNVNAAKHARSRLKNYIAKYKDDLERERSVIQSKYEIDYIIAYYLLGFKLE